MSPRVFGGAIMFAGGIMFGGGIIQPQLLSNYHPVPYAWVMSHMNEFQINESCHIWMSSTSMSRIKYKRALKGERERGRGKQRGGIRGGHHPKPLSLVSPSTVGRSHVTHEWAPNQWVMSRVNKLWTWGLLSICFNQFDASWRLSPDASNRFAGGNGSGAGGGMANRNSCMQCSFSCCWQ